ncbi:MAG: hypothetical protein AAGL68_04610 [Pseudomonadota bacterium]
MGSLALPASAKDSLGVYSSWAAFRDPGAPRCYAIAKPSSATTRRDYSPYASVASWPARSIRNQFHIRLSRELATNARIRLAIGSKRFNLTGGGGDAWAKDAAMDAAIIAAMRSATQMSVRARDKSGRAFTDRYQLAGAATAIDAALLGCAELR